MPRRSSVFNSDHLRHLAGIWRCRCKYILKWVFTKISSTPVRTFLRIRMTLGELRLGFKPDCSKVQADTVRKVGARLHENARAASSAPHLWFLRSPRLVMRRRRTQGQQMTFRATPNLDRYLTLAQVESVHPVSRSTRWRMVRAGTFPRPVRLSPGRIGWREGDIRDWCLARLSQ